MDKFKEKLSYYQLLNYSTLAQLTEREMLELIILYGESYRCVSGKAMKLFNIIHTLMHSRIKVIRGHARNMFNLIKDDFIDDLEEIYRNFIALNALNDELTEYFNKGYKTLDDLSISEVIELGVIYCEAFGDLKEAKKFKAILRSEPKQIEQTAHTDILYLKSKFERKYEELRKELLSTNRD